MNLKKYLIVIVILAVVVVTIVVYLRPTVLPQLVQPQSATSVDLTALLNEVSSSKMIATDRVSGLFELPQVPATPVPLFEDPVQNDTFTGVPDKYTAGVSATHVGDYADVTIDGNIPQDFVKTVTDGLALGIIKWNELYDDANFHFADALKKHHVKVFISSNEAKVRLLSGKGAGFDIGRAFVYPCQPEEWKAGNCAPQVTLFYSPGARPLNTYSQIAPTLVHEMFHVGQSYLMNSVNKIDLFQIPGYYWQTEGLATLTERQLPYPEVYSTFGKNGFGLVDESYFKWAATSNKTYDSSYQATPFLDEIFYQYGDNPKTAYYWMTDLKPGETSGYSLMNLLAGTGKGEIDLGKFQNLYVKSLLDLYLPGMLSANDIQVDPRTFGLFVPPVSSPNDVVITADSPATITTKFDTLSDKQFVFKITRSENAGRTLTLSIDQNGSGASSVKAVVVLEKQNSSGGEALYDCYHGAALGDNPVLSAKICFKSNAKIIGSFDVLTKRPIEFTSQIFDSFGIGTAVSLDIFMVNTIDDSSAVPALLKQPVNVNIVFGSNEKKTEVTPNTCGGKAIAEGDACYFIFKNPEARYLYGLRDPKRPGQSFPGWGIESDFETISIQLSGGKYVPHLGTPNYVSIDSCVKNTLADVLACMTRAWERSGHDWKTIDPTPDQICTKGKEAEINHSYQFWLIAKPSEVIDFPEGLLNDYDTVSKKQQTHYWKADGSSIDNNLSKGLCK
ncbi:MAG: hypothetical protein HY226_06670 [Candidatus Vogelbacteria bacterium]|nr:hypothetical protein [Candidatus Vogelbacteria bacterium]